MGENTVAGRNTVSVDIFGKTYSVLAGADPEYTRTLARYVDEQMQNVSKQSKAVDTQKVAVLAALNIANELFQAERTEFEIEKRTTDLLAMVESAE